MANSAKLGIAYVDPSQAQKHVTVNNGFKAFDALVQLSVLDIDRTVPPNGPNAGDTYVLGTGATGVWAGQDDKVAYYDGAAWNFYAPLAGWLAYAQDDDLFYRYNGGWAVAPTPNTFDQLGVGGATPDGTNKFAFYGTNMLFNSGGSIDATFNKDAAGDDASFSFKQGLASKALMGLLGNNDFTLKVGSGFHTAIVADENTGRVSFPNGGGAPNVCQTRNTDTTTDLDTGAAVEVPLTGVEDMRDASWFTIVGNGVRCLKAGRVRVAASVHLTSPGPARVQVAIELRKNGAVQGGKGNTSYMRIGATGQGETASSHIQRWIDVAANDIISVQATRAGAASARAVAMTSGESLLILEQW